MPKPHSQNGSRLTSLISTHDSCSFSAPRPPHPDSTPNPFVRVQSNHFAKSLLESDLIAEKCSAIANDTWFLESYSVVLIVEDACASCDITSVLQAAGLTVFKGFESVDAIDSPIIIVDVSSWQSTAFQNSARQFEQNNPNAVFCILTGAVSYDWRYSDPSKVEFLDSQTPDARAVLTSLGIGFHTPKEAIMLDDLNNNLEHSNSFTQLVNVPKIALRNIGKNLHKMAEQRLWEQVDVYNKSFELEGCGVIVGFDNSENLSLRQILNALGTDLDVRNVRASQLDNIAKSKDDCSFLILNMDGFLDVETGVDALLSFRDLRPDVTVIVTSSTVSGDDLETSRRAICDATLQLPVSSDRLEKGIIAAVQNNAAFCGTRSSLGI